MPTYRIKNDAVIGGALYLKGAIVKNHNGWPNQNLEPLDDAASTITEYFRTYGNEPFLPDTPYDARSGQIYLPGQLPNVRGRSFPPAIEPDDAPARMPRYRMRSSNGAEFGSKRIGYGTVFAYAGWPELTMSIAPANEEARAVLAYFEANHSRPYFPLSPFNLFDNTLWLPQLPEPEVDDPRPAYVTAPSPKGFTPPPWTTTSKIPTPIYNKRRASKYQGDDAA